MAVTTLSRSAGDDSGDLYLVVHSGSRHLGKQVAEYYQNRAYRELREAGRAAGINRQLAYLHGNSFREYLDDMKIVQRYATMNRKAIVDEDTDAYETERRGPVHNDPQLHRSGFHDPEKGCHFSPEGRKGAHPDQHARRPDLHREGKRRLELFSAARAGRKIMSRREAKKSISLKEYENTMKGIYSTTVNRSHAG